MALLVLLPLSPLSSSKFASASDAPQATTSSCRQAPSCRRHQRVRGYAIEACACGVCACILTVVVLLLCSGGTICVDAKGGGRRHCCSCVNPHFFPYALIDASRRCTPV